MGLTDEECPVCYETYARETMVFQDSKAIEKNSQCTHWFCVNCLKKMSENDICVCPLCRRDISDLVNSYLSDDGEEEKEYMEYTEEIAEALVNLQDRFNELLQRIDRERLSRLN
jgi:uncharacterized protein (DUF2225 family)